MDGVAGLERCVFDGLVDVGNTSVLRFIAASSQSDSVLSTWRRLGKNWCVASTTCPRHRRNPTAEPGQLHQRSVDSRRPRSNHSGYRDRHGKLICVHAVPRRSRSHWHRRSGVQPVRMWNGHCRQRIAASSGHATVCHRPSTHPRCRRRRCRQPSRIRHQDVNTPKPPIHARETAGHGVTQCENPRTGPNSGQSGSIVSSPASAPNSGEISADTTYLGRPAIRFTSSPEGSGQGYLGNQICY
jgi:hypothetical protein